MTKLETISQTFNRWFAISTGKMPEVPLDSGAVKKGLNVAFLWAGIICVIIIVASGLMYVTSIGDQGKIGKAKLALSGAVIGLVVIIMSFAIVNLVLGAF